MGSGKFTEIIFVPTSRDIHMNFITLFISCSPISSFFFFFYCVYFQRCLSHTKLCHWNVTLQVCSVFFSTQFLFSPRGISCFSAFCSVLIYLFFPFKSCADHIPELMSHTEAIPCSYSCKSLIPRACCGSLCNSFCRRVYVFLLDV